MLSVSWESAAAATRRFRGRAEAEGDSVAREVEEMWDDDRARVLFLLLARSVIVTALAG